MPPTSRRRALSFRRSVPGRSARAYGAVAAFLFATGDFLLRRSLGAAERTLYSASLQVNRLLRRGDTAEDPGQLADIANLAVQGVMLRRIIIAGGR